MRKKARSREREFVPLLPLEDGTAMLPCKDLSLGLGAGEGAVRRPGRCGGVGGCSCFGRSHRVESKEMTSNRPVTL